MRPYFLYRPYPIINNHIRSTIFDTGYAHAYTYNYWYSTFIYLDKSAIVSNSSVFTNSIIYMT